jgi:hypothetical protein
MAGVAAGLPAGVRLSDHISLGVIARAVSPERVRQVLVETGRASERERDLPAQVMVYYVIALALYMGCGTREVLRCLLEGLRWLWGAEAVKVAGKSGISQARSRLGEAPLRRLYEALVHPIATRATKGGWYRDWRLVSLDGTCLDAADTEENRAGFGAPGASRGESAFPQLRLVALVENGTHVLFGARLGRYGEGETTLAHVVLGALRPGMLCLADRQFLGHALWQHAASTGADLLWRVKGNLRLPRETVLPDGSYLSTIYPGEADRRHRTGGLQLRVVEYRLEGVPDAEPLYRVVTSILNPKQAPAEELAGLYHERWAEQPNGSARDSAWNGCGGDRSGPGGTEDPIARCPGGAALQDPGAGAPGGLGPAAGAFRHPRPDARSGAAGRRGSRPALLLACRAGGPPQDPPVRGSFPLRPGMPCIGRC